jgi:hypothetical protein
MRRFLASAWYPFLIALVLAGAAVAAHALLPVLDSGTTNDQLLKAFAIAGWVSGPVMGVVSFLLMMILNGIRRAIRLRGIGIGHPIVVLLGICPWCVWGCQLLFAEPRYTPFARLVIDVVGRPMFVGSAAACILTVILALGLLLPSSAKKQ